MVSFFLIAGSVIGSYELYSSTTYVAVVFTQHGNMPTMHSSKKCLVYEHIFSAVLFNTGTNNLIIAATSECAFELTRHRIIWTAFEMAKATDRPTDRDPTHTG